jgi:hypothetical protein
MKATQTAEVAAAIVVATVILHLMKIDKITDKVVLKATVNPVKMNQNRRKLKGRILS